MMLRFNSGPTGISLQAMLGKTTDIVIWTDVQRALRIFRQVCDCFINPTLALHVSHLLTRVEDLRTRYPLISAQQWIRIFHNLFARLRGVNAILEVNPNIDYSVMIRELFHLDKTSPLFQEAVLVTTLGSVRPKPSGGASPDKKRQKVLPRASSTTTGRIQQPVSAAMRMANQASVIRPNLIGLHPCYHWICNRAPCFDAVTCAVSPNAKKGGKPRPHSFDPVDKGTEDDFRAWVLKYKN
jgi:hypothetical protein